MHRPRLERLRAGPFAGTGGLLRLFDDLRRTDLFHARTAGRWRLAGSREHEVRVLERRLDQRLEACKIHRGYGGRRRLDPPRDQVDDLPPALVHVLVDHGLFPARHPADAALDLPGDLVLARLHLAAPLAPVRAAGTLHQLGDELDLEALHPLPQDFQRVGTEIHQEVEKEKDGQEEGGQQEALHGVGHLEAAGGYEHARHAALREPLAERLEGGGRAVRGLQGERGHERGGTLVPLPDGYEGIRDPGNLRRSVDQDSRASDKRYLLDRGPRGERELSEEILDRHVEDKGAGCRPRDRNAVHETAALAIQDETARVGRRNEKIRRGDVLAVLVVVLVDDPLGRLLFRVEVEKTAVDDPPPVGTEQTDAEHAELGLRVGPFFDCRIRHVRIEGSGDEILLRDFLEAYEVAGVERLDDPGQGGEV